MSGERDDDRPPAVRQPLEPLAVDTKPIVLVGLAVWAVALLATLLVPAWHTGERAWWPWACVTGLVLGGLGLAYLRRGRGNAPPGKP